ncbi:MAG TPA: PilT/PilU family type 4a pilus ATPase [Acidimicrobiales bacterium]|nr:PilT/PilU family type 4a pilus ATPase [Acidimicrobiales bacterium]
MATRGTSTMIDLGTPAPVWQRFVAALAHAVAVGASDLHLKAGARPRVRVDGRLQPAPLPPFDADELEAVVARGLPQAAAAGWAAGEADFRLVLPDVHAGRFRVSALRADGGPALAVRVVAATVPDADELGLLPVVRDLAALRSGLVVIAGRVGSGKSTTCAWLVDRINATQAATIVSVEDPIEHLHHDKRGYLVQREVGADTASFATALRHLLRHDPDVVVIGEVRDGDTARVAVTAAQAGHLVLATVHADDAPGAVDRLVGLLPAGERPDGRRDLAGTLRAVVAQRLVERHGDRLRVLAQEVLLGTGRVAGTIAAPIDGPPLASLIDAGDHVGMCSFDAHLAAMVAAGALTAGEAMAAASMPSDLALRLAGGRLVPSA